MTYSNSNEIDNNEVPIEVQEQAQLAEQKFRDAAISQIRSKLIKLEGINSPADVTEPGECEECGEDVPAKRIQALMTELDINGTKQWFASPNAKICVECATRLNK